MSERCQLKDLTGQRFGKLTVISRNKDNSKSGNARWNCLCDCGNTAIVIGSKLRSGYTSLVVVQEKVINSSRIRWDTTI